MKKRQRKRKHYGEKERKFIKTKKNFLGRAAPLTFKLFTDAIEKVMKIFQE